MKKPSKQSKRRKKILEEESSLPELELVLKNAHMHLILDPEIYTEEDGVKLRDVVLQICKEIHIDKTYVDFPGTKYEKTFLAESGWNQLRQLIVGTDYGKKTPRETAKLLQEAYQLMAVNYVNIVLEDLGYDMSGLEVRFSDAKDFVVEYRQDKCKEWLTYPGKWQNWKK